MPPLTNNRIKEEDARKMSRFERRRLARLNGLKNIRGINEQFVNAKKIKKGIIDLVK